MLGFAKDVITSRSEHSLLFTTFLMAVVFAAAGVVVEVFLGNGVAAAFLSIYALLAALLSGMGYATLFAGRLLTRLRQRRRPG